MGYRQVGVEYERDERWAGEVLIRDPLASGTMRTIFGGPSKAQKQSVARPF